MKDERHRLTTFNRGSEVQPLRPEPVYDPVRAQLWREDAASARGYALRYIKGHGKQTNATGFRGVSIQSSGRFQAAIRREYIGTFDTSEEAARAFDAAAKKRYGESAVLNFPAKVAE